MPSGGPSYGSYCCVSWCFNNGRTHKKPGTSFFRVPRDGRMKAWMQYAGRDDLLSKPASLLYATYRVCSDHFTAQSFMDPGHTRLTRMAVPSVQPAAPCSLSVASSSDCDMAAEAALQGPAVEASQSGSHTLRCPDEQGGSSLVAGERISDDFVLPEKTLTSRSAVTKGTCVAGRSQDCSDSIVRGTEQASQDPPEDVSANSSTPECLRENVRSCVPATMSPSMKYKQTIKHLQAKVAAQRKTIKRLQRQPHQAPSSTTKALEVIRPHVTEEVFKLLSAHVRLRPKCKGKRFPVWFKKFALHLNFRGPRAYRFLAPYFSLPSRRSLRRWLANVKMTPGIIPGILSSIATNTQAWNERDRVCALVFDEIALKKNLYYDASRDVVQGFTDDGTHRTSTIADRALVFLLVGVSRKWVQPVAFTIGHTSTPSSVMHNLLVSLILELRSINIAVKAVICDQGSSNVSLANQLKVTVAKPFFEVNGERVYYIFDVPHLIKTTRNNVQAHKLYIGDDIVNWSHIVSLYQSSHELRLRLAPKLTERHVHQKPFSNMKVSRATQVFSASVSIAITAMVYAKVLPASAITTAQFCDRMDRIFDALNSSSKKRTSQKLRHAIMKNDSELIDFLRGQLPWIASWQFVGRRQPQTIVGWQITIQAICQLWGDLSKNYNFEYLLTRRLQQDPLENIFGHIRQKQGCNTNPNVAQFICGLKHICIRKLFKLSEYGNVEDDECDLLQEQLSPFSLTSASLVDNEECAQPQPDDFPALDDLSELATNIHSHIIDDSAAYYVAGFLIKHFLRNACDGCSCPQLLKDDSETLKGTHQYFTMLKAYHVPSKLFGNLTVPSEAAFAYVQQLESRFLAIIEATAHHLKVCDVLYHHLSSVGDFHFCSAGCRAKFLKMFCRVRLCWHVRFVNRNLDRVRFQSSISGMQLDKFKG
ncbi:uncharacterized protein LOC142769029 isoform X1 [Rhipicephalus microplus]|uniref:uncharacterized protein LOC142769029 isoform X1 n=1 Tax=Rhipicephalus microplus TaxID=6941 RepID=UPI003F6D3AC4